MPPISEKEGKQRTELQHLWRFRRPNSGILEERGKRMAAKSGETCVKRLAAAFWRPRVPWLTSEPSTNTYNCFQFRAKCSG